MLVERHQIIQKRSLARARASNHNSQGHSVRQEGTAA